MEFSIGCLLDPKRPDPDPLNTREIYNIVSLLIISSPGSSLGSDASPIDSASANATVDIENAGTSLIQKAAGIYAIATRWDARVSQSSGGGDASTEMVEHPEAWMVKDDLRVNEMKPEGSRLNVDLLCPRSVVGLSRFGGWPGCDGRREIIENFWNITLPTTQHGQFQDDCYFEYFEKQCRLARQNDDAGNQVDTR